MRRINTSLLRRVQGDMLAHPECFEMERCFSDEHRPVEHYLIHAIETTACIVGRALVLSPRKTGIVHRRKRMLSVRHHFKEQSYARDLAQRILGLMDDEADRLFFVSEWPDQFRAYYERSVEGGDILNRTHAGIQRIDHFIKTKGVE